MDEHHPLQQAEPRDGQLANRVFRCSDLEKELFRINFRSIKNDIPAQSLLSEDILVEGDQTEGWVEVDLEPYNLSFSHDIAVILQPVRSWGESL